MEVFCIQEAHLRCKSEEFKHFRAETVEKNKLVLICGHHILIIVSRGLGRFTLGDRTVFVCEKSC